MRYYDAHNHLHDPRLGALDLENWIEEAKTGGWAGAVVNGTSPADWDAVADLARRFPEVVTPSFGVHPWKIAEAGDDWEKRLVAQLDAFEGRVGVGEVGLDRWIDDADLERQEVIFRRQLAIAAKRDLPVTIHCLRAWGALLEVMRNEALPARGFLVHSVGASPDTIRQLADLGGYFSASGSFADSRQKKFGRALEAIPPDRLLIETDAPDMLPPENWREAELRDPATGEAVCHPGNIFAVYRYVAEFRRESVGMLGARVTQNFERFFGQVTQS